MEINAYKKDTNCSPNSIENFSEDQYQIDLSTLRFNEIYNL